MKTFEFSREGLNNCLKHKDYIGIAKQNLVERPELFPLVLLGVLGLSVILISPMASEVAFKSSMDNSIIAFKYLGGF